MALYVNTNVSSMNAQNQLVKSGNTLDQVFQRLSSGLRINSAQTTQLVYKSQTV